MSEEEMKPCPFCGCEMHIHGGVFPNGDPFIEPRGWHYDDCPLSAATWHTDPEDGWTEEKIIEAWNRRAKDEQA